MLQGTSGLFFDAQGRSDSANDRARGVERGQPHETRAEDAAAAQSTCDAQRGLRLADAAAADDRNEPPFAQQPGDLGDLVSAPDKAGERDR